MIWDRGFRGGTKILVAFIFLYGLASSLESSARKRCHELLVLSHVDATGEVDRGKTREFLAAVRGGDHERVSVLIDDPEVDVNASNESDGKTAVYWAVENKDSQMLVILRSSNRVDANRAESRFGNNPLIQATRLNWVRGVEALLKFEGLRADDKNEAGASALHFACADGRLAILNRLLAVVPDPNQAGGVYGMSGLMIAVHNGHTRIITRLLQDPRVDLNRQAQRASVRIRDHDREEGRSFELERDWVAEGSTALNEAVRFFRVRVMKVLLADPRIQLNLRLANEDTVFHTALAAEGSRSDRRKALELLLQHPDSNPGLRGNLEFTPIYTATLDDDLAWVVELFLEYASTKNFAVNLAIDRRTPLFQAIRRGRSGIARTLMSFPGIDVNGSDLEQPLIFAAIQFYPSLASLLIEHSDWDPTLEFRGNTPLVAAIEAERDEVGALIAAHPDTDPNVIAKHLPTLGAVSALSAAVNQHLPFTVEAIVARSDSTVNRPVRNSVSPLIYAAAKTPRSSGERAINRRIVQALLAAGANPHHVVELYDIRAPVQPYGEVFTPWERAKLQGNRVAEELIKESVDVELVRLVARGEAEAVRERLTSVSREAAEDLFFEAFRKSFESMMSSGDGRADYALLEQAQGGDAGRERWLAFRAEILRLASIRGEVKEAKRLFDAGDYAGVIEILRKGSFVNTRNHYAYPLLTIAVRYQHLEVVEVLLAHEEIELNALSGHGLDSARDWAHKKALFGTGPIQTAKAIMLALEEAGAEYHSLERR